MSGTRAATRGSPTRTRRLWTPSMAAQRAAAHPNEARRAPCYERHRGHDRLDRLPSARWGRPISAQSATSIQLSLLPGRTQPGFESNSLRWSTRQRGRFRPAIGVTIQATPTARRLRVGVPTLIPTTRAGRTDPAPRDDTKPLRHKARWTRMFTGGRTPRANSPPRLRSEHGSRSCCV